MRAFAKIVVEQQSAEHWAAWMAGYPQISVCGEWPAVAITRLLLTLGVHEFVTNELSTIDEATRSGHLEFRLPMRRLKRMPRVSVN